MEILQWSEGILKLYANISQCVLILPNKVESISWIWESYTRKMVLKWPVFGDTRGGDCIFIVQVSPETEPLSW